MVVVGGWGVREREREREIYCILLIGLKPLLIRRIKLRYCYI